jgi:hypothetical protein
MGVPVPKNKLVAFTLVGALLTAGIAGALALPSVGLAQVGEQTDQAASDAPTPNQNFTPAVQTQSGYEEDEEHEEYEEDEEHEEYEEDEEHEEYEEDE